MVATCTAVSANTAHEAKLIRVQWVNRVKVTGVGAYLPDHLLAAIGQR